ncbi:hypothetical protein QTP86_024128 [Hemibagrus guttatus]|nr:hypothetical protein QTP86_024128 [Hemibagrus guttatus]
MDSPSKFFFSLEQKNGQKRFIHAVQTESGDPLSEPTEIRKQTVSFYSKLYSSEWSGAQVVEDSFLVGLPKLSERVARELGRELSLEELHGALQRMENGQGVRAREGQTEQVEAAGPEDVLQGANAGHQQPRRVVPLAQAGMRRTTAEPASEHPGPVGGLLLGRSTLDSTECSPPAERGLTRRGQGLVQLSSRAAAFRLQFIQRLLRLDISGVTVPALSRTLISSGIVMLRELVNVAGSDLSRAEDLAARMFCITDVCMYLLNSFSLSFNSCPPTHKEGNILDLVFTHPSPATDMTVTPLHISDHHLVSFSITLPVLPKRNPQHLSLTRRNLHSISPSSVASCTLSSLPDHESFSSLPLDSATDTLLSSLSSTMDFLCPLSTIRRKNSSPAPWLSDVLRNNRRELRSAARKWKKSKLDTDLTSYRTLLSKFSLDVTSAKTSFYKEKLETSAQDPRKLHNIFSSLLNPPAPPSPPFPDP